MPLCQHVVHGPMLRICPVCGHPAKTNGPIKRECPGPPPEPIKPLREPRTPAEPGESPYDRPACSHRGELLRTEECKPCQRSGVGATVEVFQCEVHSECTVRNTSIQPKIKGCVTCHQYQRPPVAITPE